MNKIPIIILLVVASPLWVPIYLLVGLCGLCTDGLLFMIEGYLGRSIRAGWPLRLGLSLPSLALFPAASTVETTGLFLLAAGRWPLVLILDGLILATFGLAAGRLSPFPISPTIVALVAAALMVVWLTAGNLAARWCWLHKGLTLTATAALGGFALMVQLRVDEWFVVGMPELWIPIVSASAALLVAGAFVVFRRRLTDILYDPWEPHGVAGNFLALVRGMVAVALFPVWFPVMACSWLLERIYGEMMLPDFGHRAVTGDFTTILRSSRFSSFIGLRYMKGKRDQRFVSVITVLSILAVTMGVWTLTVVLSVMSGFELDLRDKILGTNAHVVVLSYAGTFPDYDEVREKTAEVDGVEAVTPFVYTELMVKHDDHVTGAILKGVDPQTVGGVTDLVNSLKHGPDGLLPDDPSLKQALLEAIDEPLPAREDRVFVDPDLDIPGIVIGEEMAAVLAARVGDVVLVTSPFGEPGPFGTMVTTMQKFRVKSVFYSGMYEYDTKFLYVSIPAAQSFLKFGDEVTGLEVVVDDLYAADRIAREIEKDLRYPFWTRDWMAMNRNLFAALKLEKVVMAIILSFIYVGAALNIIVVLIMVVMEKQKEIAILRAMGASRTQILKAFMIEGLIIGFVGTTLGTLLGYATCLALDRYRFIPLDTDVYYLDTLPVAMSPWTFVIVAAFAITVSFLATLYPAWWAAKLDPVEGLRYE